MIHLFISSVKMFYKKWLILLEYGLLLTFPSACTGICKRTVFSGAFKLRTVVFASNCNSMNQSINQSINDKLHKNKHTFQSPFSKFMDTRLSEHCAPIIWFNCKHFLFVYIVKQKQKNLWKSYFVGGKFFEILIIHKPSLGSCKVPHKIFARSF